MRYRQLEVSLCALLLVAACEQQMGTNNNTDATARTAPQPTAEMTSPIPPQASLATVAQAPSGTMIAGETYQPVADNRVQLVAEAPVSTFSIDVDTGAYANIRRFLMHGQLPPADAVRIEEMVNYFHYDYPAPDSPAKPFRTTTRVIKTPWNPDSYLLEIGIKGYQPARQERPAANLVFLVDVSGSMDEPDKLPLLKSGLKLLAQQLTSRDRVSIVVYAGASGVALDPTPGNDVETIDAALDRLQAGGGTAGGEGLQLAYHLAQQARIDGGINRIILATDGDFNIGITDIAQLKKMIEDNRKLGISLSTLGFGEGNYNDAMMEQLADVGNGNYGYVDSLKEAKRLLVDQLDGTIDTIAKDVKIQIEFNPAVIASYRQIGYQNRALKREDFNNDHKDAGEIGAGHTVTALYEITPVGGTVHGVDPLRYGASMAAPVGHAGEFAFLRLRYKDPTGERSKLLETPLLTADLRQAGSASMNQDFAAAVAAFGQKLRQESSADDFTYDQISALAKQTQGQDEDGYRREFLDLVDLSKSLKP
jgi:Ca-activated chloride channel family protein